MNKQKILKNHFYKASLVVLLLLGVGFGLRTLNIDREFSGDETVTMSTASMERRLIAAELKEREIYPPATYFILSYWMKISTSESWVRLYFVLFGIGGCLLIYLIAREYLNEKLANIALLIATFSPLLIFASQYIRSYMDSAFWMLLSCLMMLKILKGKESVLIWTCYIVSAALSIYTFYFSALLIFSQFMFIVIFSWKNRVYILKWCLALFVVGLVFAPWIGHALGQLKNASVLSYDWSSKGFNIGMFKPGLYLRSIASLVGFDPYCMVFPGGITTKFPKILLMSAFLGGFFIFIMFLYTCLKYLSGKFAENKKMIWFLPILSLVPILIAWILAYFVNIPLNPRYLISFHALFIIFISVFIYKLLERKRFIGSVLLIFILVLFAIRIPVVVSPEIESKKALLFLEENLKRRDLLLLIRSGPDKIKSFEVIRADEYMELNNLKNAYFLVSEKKLLKEISQHQKIWFYRALGNDEVFGANDLMNSFLNKNGYKRISENKFRNINIVEFESEQKGR